MNVTVLSDTHGLLRPEALAAAEGSDVILHAGDVGDPEILARLRHIAPLHVVRGNVDRGELAELPATVVCELGEHAVYMLHIREELDLDPAVAGFSAVVFGHSHRPLIEWNRDVLFLNPGSCGPRRFSLPVTLARLRIGDRGEPLDAEIVDLL
ncbi:MAG: metallophosphoesterase family protein [Acidobacteriota bacterium]